MYLAIFFALLLAASTLGAAVPVDAEPRDASPCGVTIFIGGQVVQHMRKGVDKFFDDRRAIVTSSKKAGGRGESAPIPPCTPTPNSKDCPSFDPHGGQVYKDAVAGTFAIAIPYPAKGQKECNWDEFGSDCDPILTYPDGRSFHMDNDKTCTHGTRHPFFDPWGHWWHCEVQCMNKKGKGSKEKGSKEKGSKEKDPKEKDSKEKGSKDKDSKEKDPKKKDSKEKASKGKSKTP